jgi:uncharacterized protein
MIPMTQPLLVLITAVVMLIGLAGVFLPVLPGIELVWLAALGYGILHGFTTAGVLCFAGITLLVAIGLSSDIWITGLGMKTAGTSLLAMAAGGFLLVVGSLFFTPLVGLLLGLAGVLVVELLRHRNWKKALSSTGTALAGCGLTYGFKFVMGILMMLAWGVWVLWG